MSVFMEISVVGFYGYIGIYRKISTKILAKNISEVDIGQNSEILGKTPKKRLFLLKTIYIYMTQLVMFDNNMQNLKTNFRLIYLTQMYLIK